MKEIKLSDYATNIITHPDVAKNIYNDIINLKPLENEVVINMDGIITITIQCINILFGGLYDYLGADKFHDNLILHGCSDTLGDFMAFILKERLKKYEEGK